MLKRYRLPSYILKSHFILKFLRFWLKCDSNRSIKMVKTPLISLSSHAQSELNPSTETSIKSSQSAQPYQNSTTHKTGIDLCLALCCTSKQLQD